MNNQERSAINNRPKTGLGSMSGHWDRNAEQDAEFATTFAKDRSFGGQGHDRIHGDNPIPGVSSTIAMNGDNEDIEVDITARQKMLSAMSGSLLTSLLGNSLAETMSSQEWLC